MAVEYMLLLLISTVIILSAFGLDKGPVAMFKKNSPYLAGKLQENLETGSTFAKDLGSEGWVNDN